MRRVAAAHARDGVWACTGAPPAQAQRRRRSRSGRWSALLAREPPGRRLLAATPRWPGAGVRPAGLAAQRAARPPAIDPGCIALPDPVGRPKALAKIGRRAAPAFGRSALRSRTRFGAWTDTGSRLWAAQPGCAPPLP